MMSLVSCFLLNETKLEGLKTPLQSKAHPEIREMISVFVHQVRYRPKGYYCVEKTVGTWWGGVTSLPNKKLGGPVCDSWFVLWAPVCFERKVVPISSTENIPRSLLRTVYIHVFEELIVSSIISVIS